MTGFEKRRLGRTSREVSVIGLGTATMGGHRVQVTRETAEAIARAAWGAGLRYLDTAPLYGFGQSEHCIGDAMRAIPRDDWVLSTKVGRLLRPRPSTSPPDGYHHSMPFDVVHDYTYDGIMRSFEDSLQRLGLARIDILYAHDIGATQRGMGADAEAMRMRTF